MTVLTRPAISTLDASNVSPAQLEALAQFAGRLEPGELRDLLLSLTRKTLDGADLALIEESSEYTPTQAATQLGMSRTHLYKLLDRGEIPSHRVGRDRRIRREDLMQFEADRQRDRRELAERFAHRDRTRTSVLDELADDL
jgi:excisionase family DNA binding protein